MPATLYRSLPIVAALGLVGACDVVPPEEPAATVVPAPAKKPVAPAPAKKKPVVIDFGGDRDGGGSGGWS